MTAPVTRKHSAPPNHAPLEVRGKHDWDSMLDEVEEAALAAKDREARVRLLRRIASAALAVSETLDTSGTCCAACGLTKKTNWDEAQAVDLLKGAANRIEHAVAKMAGKVG